MNFKRLFALAAILGAAYAVALACTGLLVGKKASADGSTLISYAADSHILYGFLHSSPAADYAPGEMRRVVDWDEGKYRGEIPQVAHTYNVVGNMNENQVSVTESTFGGRWECVDANGLIDYGSLIYIALERSKTAREAIKVMTDLVAKYGYCSGGESFSIADPNEIWIMEMMGKGGKEKGAVWVAIRIPDDCIAGHANQSRIRQIPFKDKENCMYSKDVVAFARQMGWYNGSDEEFSFADTYNPLDYSGLRGCDARVWSFYKRYADDMDKYLPYLYGKKTKDILPLYVKPNKKVSVRDVQNMMRDHFEGTPFDMTKDPGATNYDSVPYRWRPMNYKVDGVEYLNERAIATQQTGFVLVSQMRGWLPNHIGGIHWFGCDDANTALFVPMYCCMTRVPKAYDKATADLYTFSTESAFWVNNMIANQAYHRYSFMIKDIRKVQGEIEDGWAADMSKVEAEAKAMPKDKAVEYLTNYSCNEAQKSNARYLQLAQYLFVKYMDGNIKKEQNGQFLRNPYGTPEGPDFPGYTPDYYRTIVKESGDRLKVLEIEK